jgi:hypothetical protein
MATRRGAVVVVVVGKVTVEMVKVVASFLRADQAIDTRAAMQKGLKSSSI